MHYLLADLISILKVGSKGHLTYVKVRNSNFSLKLLEVLRNNGVISSFKVKGNFIFVRLKYYNNRPVFSSIEVISKPSRRVYWSLNFLSLISSSYNFSGFYIVSTPKGLLTSVDCLFINNICGEVLVRVEI